MQHARKLDQTTNKNKTIGSFRSSFKKYLLAKNSQLSSQLHSSDLNFSNFFHIFEFLAVFYLVIFYLIFVISNLIFNLGQRATGLSVFNCYVLPSINKVVTYLLTYLLCGTNPHLKLLQCCPFKRLHNLHFQHNLHQEKYSLLPSLHPW